MLHRYIAKLIMSAARDQAKMACESLQLYMVIEAGIEGATYAVAQRRQECTMPEPGSGVDEGS